MNVLVLIRVFEDGFANSCLWTSVEVNVGTVCACLPVLRPFIQNLFGGLLGFRRLSKEWLSRYGLGSSHESTSKDFKENASVRSTAPFRKLDEEVIALPPKAGAHATSIKGGSDADIHGMTGDHNESIPLNAIHVQRNVDLTSRPFSG